MSLFDLEAKISLNIEGYKSGIKSAQKSMENFSSLMSSNGIKVSKAVNSAGDSFKSVSDASEKSAEKSAKALGSMAKKSQDSFKSASDAAKDHAKEAEEAVSESADRGVSKLQAGAGRLSAFAIAKAQLIIAAAKKAGEVLIGFGRQAVSAFADYEQLVGGVDTLFKDASFQVQRYAKDAYLTVGMDANTYMETVTGFSASLLQSMEGDTKKAAEKAHLAMTDMADNANKMGTSLESVRYAYQGFAKGNYMMLDNLKIGYGGTRAEMERLLADAEKFSGINYDISSYADIIDAIHVIQTEMDITGTTAKEASETISGSMAAAKSAWNNLLAGTADSNANQAILRKRFTKALKTAAKNLIPAIKTTGKQLLATAEDLAPEFSRGLGNLIGKITIAATVNIPKILKGVFESAGELVKGFLQSFGIVVDKASSVERSLYHLSDSEAELSDRAEEAMYNLQQLNKAFQDNSDSILAETGRTQDLWEELQTLADSTGRVSNANRNRAAFILGELNSALGTEYSMNGNIIAQYGEMQREIDKLIQKKQAESLLMAGSDANAEMLSSKGTIARDMATNAKIIEQNENALEAAYTEISNLLARHGKDADEFFGGIDWSNKTAVGTQAAFAFENIPQSEINDLDISITELAAGYANLTEIKSEYAAQEAELIKIERETYNYQRAQEAAVAGDYERAMKYLTESTAVRWEMFRQNKEISEQEKADLKADLDFQVDYAMWYKEQMDKNLPGFTEEAWFRILSDLDEYHEIWEEQTGEAYTLGEMLVNGIIAGLESKERDLIERSRTMMKKVNHAVNEYWEIASPSRRAKRQSAYIGEGWALGMESKLPRMLGAAKRMQALADRGSMPAKTSAGGSFNSSYTDSRNVINSLSINVSGSYGQDFDALADAIAQKLNADIIRREAVYA